MKGRGKEIYRVFCFYKVENCLRELLKKKKRKKFWLNFDIFI